MWGLVRDAASAILDDIVGSCAEAGLNPAASSNAANAAEAPATWTNIRRHDDSAIARPLDRSQANLRLVPAAIHGAPMMRSF